MRIALISDIHGNAEAFTGVLRDIEKQKVDKIACLGDVIGYGCQPLECLKLVQEHCDIRLMGNHEFAALGCLSTQYYRADARQAAEWTHNQLTDFEMGILAEFDMDAHVGDLYLVHSSPFEPDKWHYILRPDQALQAFESFDQKICFSGHSHLPMIFCELPSGLPSQKVGHDFLPDPENRYLINVGSVGQPRDEDPRACYLIFDDEEYEAIYRRIDYDIKTVQTSMKAAKLPEILIDRLAVGK